MAFSSDPALLINQLPISTEFSDNSKLFNEQITLIYKRIANSVNTKTGGLHDKVERFNSDQYFTATPNVFRNVYRKSFDLIELNGGPIMPGSTLSAPHGITGIVLIVDFYGGVSTSLPDFRPLPYVATGALTSMIAIRADTTNLYVMVGTTSPTILTGVLTLEYVKQ